MKIHVTRLLPGNDLKEAIETFCLDNNIAAGIMLGCVGSLSLVSLRMAGAETITIKQGDHEILSLSGTLSLHGIHLHLAVSDHTGNVSGGHLSAGCKVRTTAELVIGEIEGMIFLREQDGATGYRELKAVRR